MSIRGWLGALPSKFLRQGTKASKPRKMTFRPQMEQLERREVQATFIQFDYGLDTNGFFNAPERRAALEYAGRQMSARLGDTLAEIRPGGSNTWSASITNPATGANITRNNPVVPADTIVVFAGGRDLAAPTLANAGPGGWSGNGDANWLNLLKGRGEPGALAASPTDVAPAVGYITFDTVGPTWNFSTTNGPSAGVSDFVSVALHELGHVLGVGTSAPWTRLGGTGVFTGAAATASFGRNVPLDPSRQHWADGTRSGGAETAFDPTITNGTRTLLSPLDLAGLKDIGWEITAPGQPNPPPTPTPTPTPNPPPTQGTAIDAKYAALGGTAGFLGQPVGPEGVLPDGVGRFRHYQNGSIFWHPNTGAKEVHGAIRTRYFALGAERFLGYPTSDETSNNDGRGRYNLFQYGVIQWSPQTGANEIYGAILQKYQALGGHRSVLGYATSGELNGAVNGVRLSRFEKGVIIWSQSTGAHEVYGAILATYNGLGAERSVLGLPTSGETSNNDGKGRYNLFQRGVLQWSPQTGAHEIYGAILGKYQAIGSHRSVLGYATSGERANPDGRGRYQWFQNGVIQWSPQTGANVIYGAILSRYLSLGGYGSVLGYATTSETGTPDGRGRYNHFERGSIYWTPQTGAQEVYGQIRALWANLGWERSWLGYPTSGEFAITGGRRSNFQGGYIVWSPAGGAKAFRY